MRVTARKLIEAYEAGKFPRCAGNSAVTSGDGLTLFSLHGSPIVAVSEKPGEQRVVRVSFAGWPTVTTRSRINDICYGLYGHSPVSQREREQYVTGHGKVEPSAGLWYQVYPEVSK